MSSARTRPFTSLKRRKAAIRRNTVPRHIGASTSSFTRLPVGPNTLVRKLRYVDSVVLNAGTGTAVNHFFSANGLFDPDITGTGHQPLAFDQYIAMYDHYKVLSSKMTIHPLANPSASTADNQQIVTIYLDDDTTGITNSNNMIEQGQSSYMVINSGASVSPKQISKSFVSSTFFSNRLSSSQLLGTSSANPSEQCFYNISTSALNGSGDPVSMAILVVIDYVVSFTERKTLGSS